MPHSNHLGWLGLLATLSGGCLLSAQQVGVLSEDESLGSSSGPSDGVAMDSGAAEGPGCVDGEGDCPEAPQSSGYAVSSGSDGPCETLMTASGNYISTDAGNGVEWSGDALGELSLPESVTLMHELYDGSLVFGASGPEGGSLMRSTPERDAFVWMSERGTLAFAPEICRGQRPRGSDLGSTTTGEILFYTGACTGDFERAGPCEQPEFTFVQWIDPQSGASLDWFTFASRPVLGRSGLATLTSGSIVVGLVRGANGIVRRHTDGIWDRVAMFVGPIVEVEAAPGRGFYVLWERSAGDRELVWLDDDFEPGPSISGAFEDVAVTPEGAVVALSNVGPEPLVARVDAFDSLLEPLWTVSVVDSEEEAPLPDGAFATYVAAGAGGRLIVVGTSPSIEPTYAWSFYFDPQSE